VLTSLPVAGHGGPTAGLAVCAAPWCQSFAVIVIDKRSKVARRPTVAVSVGWLVRPRWDAGRTAIGCEHLLLGLAAEPDGIAGTTLRAQGADHRTRRRAVVAALAGYVHLRAQGQQAAACRHISRHPNRILPLLT
jgi:ClpA/ClpB-like protein